MIIAAIALAAAAPMPQAAHHRPIGMETKIPFAGNGGLRNWQAGKKKDILYVQDSRLKWYRVKLSGPCVNNVSARAIGYKVGVDGVFDRFSRVYSNEHPGALCGVKSIKTSLPPQGQPGAPEPDE